MDAAKAERARLVLATSGVGCVAYAAVLLKRYVFGTPAEKDTNGYNLGCACIVASGGAVTALQGVRAFMRFPAVPIWLPTLLTSSCAICYFQRNQRTLLTNANNEKLREHVVTIAPLAFFAGWTAGPLCYWFHDFVWRVFAPYSIATMLGFAAGFAATEPTQPLRMLFHLPMATVSFAGGIAYPLINGFQGIYTDAAPAAARGAPADGAGIDRQAYQVFLMSTGLAGLWMSAYTGLVWALKPEIDVATHALALMVSGPAAALYGIKKALHAKARAVRDMCIERRQDKHDERGVGAAVTLTLAGMYYYALMEVRGGAYRTG